MTDREKIRDAFAPLHASADTLTEVLNMTQKHSHTQPVRRTARRGLTLALAAALLLALGVTAYALSAHSGFFRSVFGTGLEGRDAFEVPITDEDGNLIKTEHYPAVERIEVDEELAESLTGGYIAAVGQSAEAGGYSFTVKDLLLDANGIGALTVHVSNPAGHGLSLSSDYGPGGHQPFGWFLFPAGDELHFMDDRDYVVPDTFTDTEADIVFYFTPFTPLPKDAGLTLRFSVYTEGMDPPAWPKAELSIPAQEKLPCRELAGDGVTASLSPVGLTLRYDAGTLGMDSIVIVYADGSEYTVQGEDLVNFSVASISPDQTASYYSFNRLCDADNAAEIRLQAHRFDDTANPAQRDTVSFTLS